VLPDYRVRQRDVLLEIARAITQELDLPRLLDRILRYAVEMLGGKAGLIALCDPPAHSAAPRGAWHMAAVFGLKPAFVRVLEPLLKDLPSGGDPQTAVLPELDKRLRQVTRAASLGLLTSLGLPMVAREEAVGVVFVFRDFEGGFGADERGLLQSFADQAAIAVANARAFTQVTRRSVAWMPSLKLPPKGSPRPRQSHPALQSGPAAPQRFRAAGGTGRPSRPDSRCPSRSGTPLEQAQAGRLAALRSATLYVEHLVRQDGSQIAAGISLRAGLRP
jgi:hypothetical protein